ncbi:MULTISPECIES: ABC transporter substrate-binding protein [Cyclobacteriaceae]|jgi:iron complex transport system substrate-binding protein|uniref:ABC transporter substrate-binding protein n=1 Tax=Cyclobacteriaceae TaxID=563798 RepID=UPI00119D21C4|nr:MULTISPECIES: ABC transporter substrate-binding protein [Cyclobacteriaceae]MBD3629850.1 ABC transporter substrate-binding protein [Cyclobacterium sp.]QYH39270.1 ABC transporter substrate-binding protein [Algoriphagus sp. NBT04N3]
MCKTKPKIDFRIINFVMMWVVILLGACNHKSGHTAISHTKEGLKTITDMRNVSVDVPISPERIITVSDGMLESVLWAFGKLDKVIALGSRCVQHNFSYDIPGKNKTYRYTDGMNPIRVLYPETAQLPLIASSGLPLQLEQMVALQPDLVVLREGSCTLNNLDDPKSQQALSMLKSMGIPVVVLKGTTSYDPPNLDMLNQEILLLGMLFDKTEEAQQLVTYLNETIQFIKNRTFDLQEHEKPKVLMLGLSPVAREGGSAGVTRGTDTIEGYFIETVINANNAIQGRGGRSSSLMLSEEQILALDPDVIILHTASGYHPPEEIYEAPYYSRLQNLRAVKEKKVIALPWTPCNCSKRLEYPIEVMMIAKSAYPEAFTDIQIHEWVLDFYQKTYHIDREMAIKLRSAQWLDWTIDYF